VPGIDIIGPLPEGVQSITVFTGGVLTTAADPAAARALLAYLVTPAVAAVLRTKGMEG
jgi:molybdate transport system substrate-binding protein